MSQAISVVAESDRPYRVKPFTPLRRIIAERMTEAKRTIPHYRVTMDIEMDAVITLRKKLNAETPDQSVSVNDFIIKASAQALMAMPEVNSQLVNNEVHEHRQADISVVVAVDGGLATPIVRSANEKNLRQIGSEVKDLAARAAAGKLKRQDIEGGTFSISNLGKYGVNQFDAIINPPQIAILAVGTASPQPIVRDQKIAIATLMRASLSLDHRAIDGAVGSAFLACIKKYLESPVSLVQVEGDA